MSSRIEVELTSQRDDGTWTWRAAGAKQPKGDLDGGLLYDGAKVGDVVRAEADFLLDGIVVLSVQAPKGSRKEPERLEIIGPSRRDEQLVTTQLAPKGRGRRDGERGGRRGGDRDDRRGRDGRPGDGERRGRPGGERDSGGERRERRPRPERPAPEPRPKPKRLRAGRTHRNAVLAGLPEEQKPVAEQVLRGGIPAVRQAVEKQNEANKAEGKPEISAGPLLALAEELTPPLRTAEWRDRAEAALADMGELDLRDLRSVVVAADAAARDEETRELAERLRAGLSERVDAEHAAWLAELEETLSAGRVVRALRVSSRPPKAGAPFPAELAARLAEEAAKGLTSDTGSDRYATVLDALAYSPVRGQVTPEGVPAEPSEALMTAVRKLASRLPAIASLFGVEAPASSARGGRGRSRGKGGGKGGAKPVPPPPPAPGTASAPTTEAAVEAAAAAGDDPTGTPSVDDSAPTVDAAPVEGESSSQDPASAPTTEAAVEAAAAAGDDPTGTPSVDDSAPTVDAAPVEGESSQDPASAPTTEAAVEAAAAAGDDPTGTPSVDDSAPTVDAAPVEGESSSQDPASAPTTEAAVEAAAAAGDDPTGTPASDGSDEG